MIPISLLKKILYSTWVLAVIPSLVIFLFLPPGTNRYFLNIEPINATEIYHGYDDLNSDSVSEGIFANKTTPYFCIVIRDSENRFFNQWNLKDSLNTRISGFFTGNYDHDSYRELFVFTHNEDSLFLNMYEIFEHNGSRIERMFVTRIGYLNGEVSSLLYPAGFFDTNGDGYDEMYFSISSFYRLGERKLYSVDLKNRSISTSRWLGSTLLHPRMDDVDNDGRPEIFGNMPASGNYSTKVPYSDSSAWFMVFNDKLEFEFDPVEFPGFANGVIPFHYTNGNFSGYLLFYQVNNADTSMKSKLMLFSSEGNLIRTRVFSKSWIINPKEIFLVENTGYCRVYVFADKIYEVDELFNIVHRKKLPFSFPLNPYNSYTFSADINNDQREELLFYSFREKRLVIYNSDLQKITVKEIDFPRGEWNFWATTDLKRQYKLFLRIGDSGFNLSLSRNHFYHLSYVQYPGIYLLFVLFIAFVKRINTFQVVSKEELKRRLVSLQLKGIKSQLDPHFTFNTLNSVASLIYLEDRKAAYDYLSKYTQLLRSIVNDAERIYRSLGEELEFVRTYLELEKLRFGEKLDYEISIEKGVNLQSQVPKMVLQTFTENAIKHGIAPSPSGGLLKISITRKHDYLCLTVEDNGIGRAASAGMSTSTGKGMKISSEFFDILNQINKKPIALIVTDLHDSSGKPAGTRVEIRVPAE